MLRSLVGSEMCIRDRSKGQMPKADFLPRDWYDTPNIHLSTISDFEVFCRMRHIMIEQLIGLRSCETGTVSYTHLRAHETPEHLVCRLLLEKKKKKKTNNRRLYRKSNTKKIPRKIAPHG